MPEPPSFRPLARLDIDDDVTTAGRLAETDDGWRLDNAHVSRPLSMADDVDVSPVDGALARVSGYWDGDVLSVESLTIVHRPDGDSTARETDDPVSPGEALRERDRARSAIRRVFEGDDFLEVETAHAVEAPGTDLYLEPVGTRGLGDDGDSHVAPHLHTSPEFAMKRLLTEGFERIYQFATVWRDGETTDWHHPEFTMLEWYRAWAGADAVMGDVEAVVDAVIDDGATVAERTSEGIESETVDIEPPFARITMRQLVRDACGFDLFDALDYDGLWRACREHELLPGRFEARHPRDGGRWDDLFFELMITRLEPRLAEMGAVFVTEWPAPLAILARKKPNEPRVAERFELYVGGIELANGFRELTDPREQRERFERELEERRQMGMPELPMPETFLDALDYGMPPSTGVALGFDRLLMLELGASTIETVVPMASRPKAR
jgi:lysyl-tRNA synthetase class 2